MEFRNDDPEIELFVAFKPASPGSFDIEGCVKFPGGPSEAFPSETETQDEILSHFKEMLHYFIAHPAFKSVPLLENLTIELVEARTLIESGLPAEGTNTAVHSANNSDGLWSQWNQLLTDGATVDRDVPNKRLYAFILIGIGVGMLALSLWCCFQAKASHSDQLENVLVV